MSRDLRGKVASGLAVLALGVGLACVDVASNDAPLNRPITMDLFPMDGTDSVVWRIDVVGIDHRTDLNTSDYLVRIRDDQGEVVEEREMRWRDMVPPEASADAMFLMNDATFPTLLQQLREEGVSVADIVSGLAELLAERTDESSGEILDALKAQFHNRDEK